jgi:D-alanyl-D-alanine carboxypeptidase
MEKTKSVALGLMAALLLGAAEPATRFGHHRYDEAPFGELRSVGRYRATNRDVRLRAPAAEAFTAMAAAAAKDGIGLIPISGFRSAAYQRSLFDRATRRYGSAAKAARWVAPPGYSEHAAGWSLDLGDAAAPAADVDTSFETTAAFAWLARHAAEHRFELSFPRGNDQGVNYEPWHWRYIGVDDAHRLFRLKDPRH